MYFMAPKGRGTRKFETGRAPAARASVSGKNIAISAALKAALGKRIRALGRRYFARTLRAAVTVAREGPGFRVECEVRPIPGLLLHSRAEGPELLPVLDLALAKAEKQLRRFKRRITNHHDSARRPERTAAKP